MLALFFVGACNSDNKENSEATPSSSDAITIQLKWLHNPQFAGFYVADAQEFYKEKNLSVTFLQGGPEVNRVSNVTSGQAQIGITYGDDFLREVANGAPLIAIGAIYQKNPLAYANILNEGEALLETADAWKGLKVGSPGGKDNELILFGILDSLGITPADVTEGYFGTEIGPFVEGQADVMAVFQTDQALVLDRAGYDTQIITPEDYGVQVYSDIIFVTQETYEQHKDLIQRFMDASLKGWQYAAENTNDTVAAIKKFSSADTPLIQQQWEANVPFIYDEGQLFRMEEEVFTYMMNLMIKQGPLSETIDLKKVYTTEFLQ